MEQANLKLKAASMWLDLSGKLNNAVFQEKDYNKAIELYTELESLYDELKNKYGIDKTQQFNRILDSLESHLKSNLEKNNNQNEQKNNDSVPNMPSISDIKLSIEKLQLLMKEENDFNNIKKMFNFQREVNDLVINIATNSNQLLTDNLITENDYNSISQTMINLGFEQGSYEVYEIESKFKKIDMLIDEKNNTKHLQEINEILTQILDIRDQIMQLIDEAKTNKSINFKQVEIYDTILERYKEMTFTKKY